MHDNVMDYELIIFDLDGTLSEYKTGKLLEGVKDWFDNNKSKYKLAIATNQGGVGLRYWMESAGFGDPSQYPTAINIDEMIDNVLQQLDTDDHDTMICVSYAYQSKSSGKWGPAPDDAWTTLRWQISWRKPNIGMLHHIIEKYQLEYNGRTVLMVGDGDEDRQAAKNMGIDFIWAHEFFNREKPERGQ